MSPQSILRDAPLRGAPQDEVEFVENPNDRIRAQPSALLDVGDLCRMFEEAEDASLAARKDAERDRDYVDGKQLSAEEIAVSRILLFTAFAQP
jgi:hypothetical protein